MLCFCRKGENTHTLDRDNFVSIVGEGIVRIVKGDGSLEFIEVASDSVMAQQ